MIFAKSKIFKKINVIYSLLIIVIISIVMLCLYFFSTGAITNNLINSNKELLTQINNNIDLRLFQIDQTIIKFIQADEKLSKYMSDDFTNKDNYIDSVLSLQKQLNSFINSDPNIHSIYIYSKYKGQILTNANTYDSSNFYDYDYLVASKENLINGNWFSTRKVPNDIQPNRSNSVITLIRSFPIIQQSYNPQGYIVVNVDEQILRNVIDKITPPSLGSLLIIDNNGQIISGKIDQNKKMILEKEKTNLFRSNDGNFFEINNMFVFSKASSYTKWGYVSIVSKSEIFYSLNRYYLWFFVFWIVFLGTSLLLNRKISNFQFKPIDALFRFIITKNNNIEPYYNYSLKNVETEVINLFNDRTSLEKQIEANLPIIKWRLVFDLIMGYQTDYKKIIPQLEILNIKLYASNYIVMIIKPIHNIKDYDMSIIRENTELVIQTYIDEVTQGVCVELNGIFVALLSFDNNDEDKNLIITTSCAQLIKNNIKFDCTIGIGNQVDTLAMLNESYLQSLEAVKYFLVFECDNIISFKDVNMYKSDKLYKYSDEMDTLITHFKIGNIVETKVALRKIYDKALSNKVPPEFIYQISAQIITRAIEEMSNLKINIQKLLGNEYSKEYYVVKEILISFTKINELYNYMVNVLECFIDEIVSQKNPDDKTEKNIEDIAKYVEENYMQPLSLNLIGGKYGYNPNYLSTIFKQIYGVSFIDYLIGIRLKKAKELLLNSDIPTGQIAEEVGYTTQHGFIRTFKKYTGLSPSEFRNKMK